MVKKCSSNISMIFSLLHVVGIRYIKIFEGEKIKISYCGGLRIIRIFINGQNKSCVLSKEFFNIRN